MKFTLALATLISPALVAGKISGIFDSASTAGAEKKLSPFTEKKIAPTKPIVSPIVSPISPPSLTPKPTACDLSCEVDADCPRICQNDSPYGGGTCVVGSVPTTPAPTPAPNTPAPTMCACDSPSIIPDECEVDILIDMMEVAVSGNLKLIAQLTRAAFHDAGTFDQDLNEGGANGCLLNDPLMRLEPENSFLNIPLNTLEAIKDAWHADPNTCIDVSSADMLQFAIFFAVHRQKGVPESLFSGTPEAATTRDKIKTEFFWGRPDETDCEPDWTDNLPGFTTAAPGSPIPGPFGRCAAAGEEIKEKMMDRNGFTAEEATVLIGAHTIGLVRNTFGPSHAGAWVVNGFDNASPDGPFFDNTYHKFLINGIVENNAADFAANMSPFDVPFPTWFQDTDDDLDHLDTDIALAFPPEGAHPNFRVFSSNFADDNDLFLAKFFEALEKMSRLGVTATLSHATACESPCGSPGSGGGSGGLISVDATHKLIKMLGSAIASADMAILDTQEGRLDEIKKLTEPIKDNGEPTGSTRPTEVSTSKTEATKIVEPTKRGSK